MATFFFDNDISFRIVHALRQLVDSSEHELLALRDRFPQATKDIDWIPEAGRNGWIVISRDHNQRRRDAEHRALMENNVTVLYVRHTGQALQLYGDAARLIKDWPKIEAWGLKAARGTLAKLDSNDRIVELAR